MPKFQPFSSVAIAGLLVLAGASLSVAGAYTGGYFFALDFAGQFAIQAAFTALGLAILFATLRRPIFAGVSAAVAIAGYFAITLPAPVAPCTGVSTHRVLFFNVWDGNKHPAETVDFVAHQNADTVILAEVNPSFRSALGELRKLYPYSLECPSDEYKCQFYIYSRVPVEGQADQLSRAMVQFTAAYPQATINMTAIHALRPFPFHRHWYQLWQVRHFAKLAAEQPQPRFVVGDFNAAGWGSVIRTISRIAGVKPLPSRGTWFSGMPWPLRIPIDQALVGPGFMCAKKSVGPQVFSDHRPIWVDFALKPQPAATPPH